MPTNGLAVKALMCIWAIDSLTCYVADGGDAQGTTGGDAAVSRTTNGGQNWSVVFNTGGTAGFFNGVVFSRINPQIGIAESDPPSGAGGSFYLQMTTNGGANWTLQNPTGVTGNASGQNSLFIIDNLFYGFGLNLTARIYITSNGGTSWYGGNLGVSGTFTSASAFSDTKLVGIAATSASFPNVARTTDGGTTWSPVSLGGSGTTTNSALKWINGTNTVYFVGQIAASGNIYKSTTGGTSWAPMTTAQINIFHFDFIRVGTTVTGFAVSPAGTVYKLSEPVVTSVSSENNSIPSEYKIEQNYPNPFNPSTIIKYSVPKTSFVTVKVYDVTGKLVESLLSENKNAGNYEINFNGAKYSSGVYYYTMQAGNYTETKKMILVK
jgi:photosystem II stability/assembly factor-like uncharacterized protein